MMNKLKTTMYYALIFVLAYIPQVIASTASVRAKLNSMEEITFISTKISTFATIIIVLCSVIILCIGYAIVTKKTEMNHYAFLIIFLFVISIYVSFFITMNWLIEFTIIPTMVPTILSMAIGIIGGYVIHCFTSRVCSSHTLFTF